MRPSKGIDLYLTLCRRNTFLYLKCMYLKKPLFNVHTILFSYIYIPHHFIVQLKFLHFDRTKAYPTNSNLNRKEIIPILFSFVYQISNCPNNEQNIVSLLPFNRYLFFFCCHSPVFLNLLFIPLCFRHPPFTPLTLLNSPHASRFLALST